MDESGTSSVPGNTSHFILAGLAIPIWHWRDCEREITTVKQKYALTLEDEIHTAWMLRKYAEQRKVQNFERLNHEQRRQRVESERLQILYDLGRRNNRKAYKQNKKNFAKTLSYVHLTLEERRACVDEIADAIGGWGFARLFAECIDKVHFDPGRTGKSIDEQAFEQVVSRFEHYLEAIGAIGPHASYGVLIHDNNPTVALRHTQLMMDYHRDGTQWTDLDNIIETPLFVDSRLTAMVQIADLCSYALRRYLENGETRLFELVFPRADRRHGVVVGVRHFSDQRCQCEICTAHRP